MKTTTEPPIGKFTVNGLEFRRPWRDETLWWAAKTETGGTFEILKNPSMPWAWRCARSEWQDIGPEVIHGIHASDAPAMAAIALTDAARYFRALADSFGLPDKAEGVSRLKAEIDKTTRDAADFAMMIKRLCYALRSLEATDRIHKVRAQAEDLVSRKGYHNILREEQKPDNAAELLDALKGLLAAEMLNETALSFGDASAMDAANEAKWPAVDAAKAAIARAEGKPTFS